MLRGKIKTCPFGLQIPGGCKSVGKSVFEMIPLNSEDAEAYKEYNQRIFVLNSEEGNACPYANLILEKKKSVDCKFGETTSNSNSANIPLDGSPIYPHMYVGNTSNPTHSYPLPYYADDNIRTVYYGLISLLP